MLAVGIPAYLFWGRFLGKFTNRVYYNDTPSKDLNVFQKAARMLLFPQTYWKWNYREQNMAPENDIGINLRVYTNAHYINPNSRMARYEENYCGAMMFLWPLKIFPTIIGVVEMVAIGCWRAVCGFENGVRLSGRVAYRMIGWQTMKADNEARSNPAELAERAVQQFEAQKQQLTDSKIKTEQWLKKIAKAISQCAHYQEKLAGGSPLRDRFRKAEDTLRKERERATEESARIAQAVEFFEKKGTELYAMRDLLSIYSSIHSARMNMDAESQNTLSLILAAQAACSESFRKVSDAERAQMVNLDMGIEEIAAATAQNEEAADELERRLLV